MSRNSFTGHIDKWLLLSESETDFAILFVRCWITFNAWYCTHYQNTRDRYCIDKIKEDGNQFRARLIALLDGNNLESKRFRYYIGQLHEILEGNPIPDATENMVTFKNLYFRKNPVNVTTPIRVYRNHSYKVELKSNGEVDCVIVNNKNNRGSTIYNYSHNKYEQVHFENDINNNTSLAAYHKKTIKECFNEINPKKREDLISNSRTSYIAIGEFKLINDSNLISKAIIEILYSLRCKLFHGEIQPSKNNLLVYEPCYYILRTLLPSLR